MSLDPWLPRPTRLVENRAETADVTTLRFELEAPLAFQPGQFMMLYRPGQGEAAISISGDPAEPGQLVHTIRGVGHFTRHLNALPVGEYVGLRGPFGTAWPMERAIGQDVVLVAGGIGMAPLRPAVLHLLRHRHLYGRIHLFYGARTPSDLLFLDQLHAWRGRFDLDVQVTVDRAEADWRGPVGVVTRLLQRVELDPEDTVAMTCGPEIMMRFVVEALRQRGVPDDRIHLSMERSMRCAIALCGHCQWGPHLVCRDGPVFSQDRVRHLLAIPEL